MPNPNEVPRSSDVGYLRGLVNEAKDSIKIAIKYVGADQNIGFMLFKWPDVVDSLLDLAENSDEGTYDKVVKDISPLIYEPVLLILGSLCKDHVGAIKKIAISDPVLAKRQAMALIEERTPK